MGWNHQPVIFGEKKRHDNVLNVFKQTSRHCHTEPVIEASKAKMEQTPGMKWLMFQKSYLENYHGMYPPWKLTWNPRMEVWKKIYYIFLLIFRKI